MATTTMKMVTLVDGTTFYLPFADLFEHKTSEEFEAFCENIKENEILEDVKVTRDYHVIDGQHRLLAAKALGWSVDRVPLEVCTLEDPVAIKHRAVALNTCRRQLSRDSQIKIALELRGDGLSHKAIAKLLSVGESTVRRWCSTPPDGGVEQPGTIVGEDGKARPAMPSSPAEIADRRQHSVALLAEGHSVREIAAIQNVSVGTVAGDLQAARTALEDAERARANEEARAAEKLAWELEHKARTAKWKEEKKKEDEKRKEQAAKEKRKLEKLGLKETKTEDGQYEVHDRKGKLVGRMESDGKSYDGVERVRATVFLADRGHPAVEFRIYESRYYRTPVFSSIGDAFKAYAKAFADPEAAKRVALQEAGYVLPVEEAGTAENSEPADAGAEEAEAPPTPPHPFNELALGKEEWRENRDLFTGTWWAIGARRRGDGHDATYHGNFVPQIVDQVLRRYTKRGDVVVDLFHGGGTTMLEAIRLGRHYVGIDLREDAIQEAWRTLERRPNPSGVEVALEVMDSTTIAALAWLQLQLQLIGRPAADHVILHPPYHGIIEFSDDPRCLSRCPSIEAFLASWSLVAKNAVQVLAPGKFMTVVVGNVPDEGPGTCPLAALCMLELYRMPELALWADNVKDIEGNQHSEKDDGLWTWRCLNLGIQKFKHEHVFVFKKVGE